MGYGWIMCKLIFPNARWLQGLTFEAFTGYATFVMGPDVAGRTRNGDGMSPPPGKTGARNRVRGQADLVRDDLGRTHYPQPDAYEDNRNHDLEEHIGDLD